MTRADRSVCGECAELPSRLARAAAELAPDSSDGTECVEHLLRCNLEGHSTGDHHAFVMDLDGRDTGSVWTSWTRGHEPTTVRVLPDCDATGPAPAREPCCEFAHHPGGHTWQLRSVVLQLPHR